MQLTTRTCRCPWAKDIARGAAAVSPSASKSTASASRPMCGARTPAGATQRATCRQTGNLGTCPTEAPNWHVLGKGFGIGAANDNLCCAGVRTAETWALATPRMGPMAASQWSEQHPSACRHGPAQPCSGLLVDYSIVHTIGPVQPACRLMCSPKACTGRNTCPRRTGGGAAVIAANFTTLRAG